MIHPAIVSVIHNVGPGGPLVSEMGRHGPCDMAISVEMAQSIHCSAALYGNIPWSLVNGRAAVQGRPVLSSEHYGHFLCFSFSRYFVILTYPPDKRFRAVARSILATALTFVLVIPVLFFQHSLEYERTNSIPVACLSSKPPIRETCVTCLGMIHHFLCLSTLDRCALPAFEPLMQGENSHNKRIPGIPDRFSFIYIVVK